MRRGILVSLVLLVAVIFICSDAFAGGVSNCVQPVRTTTKWLGAGATFGYNYVDKRMNNLDNTTGLKDMKVTQLNQLYGGGIIGLGDYVNIYGKIGGGNYNLKFNATDDRKMEAKLENGLYTGMGLNLLIPVYEWKPLSFGIGFDAQGNFGLNKIKSLKVSDVDVTSVGGGFYEVDGQNSLYLTVKYDLEQYKTTIVPYVGGYHSWMVVGTYDKITYYNEAQKYVKKHYNPAYDVLGFGVLVGVNVDILQYVNLNVEGRFVGETGLTAGATLKF